MKNRLVFCLILIAVLFPQWATQINLTATAVWLWMPEFRLQWKVVEEVIQKINDWMLRTIHP